MDTGNFGFTVSYNEFLQAFEGFYSFVPSTYMQYGRRLISRSPFEKNKGFIHNVGEFCRYYNQKYYPSKLETTLGENGDFTKVFNNLEYYGQVTQGGNDVPLESFHKMRMYNDYQDTGTINLTNSNLRRRMRTWRYTIPRDNSGVKARLRNQWVNLQLEYENAANKRHLVHDIIYSYTPVAF